MSKREQYSAPPGHYLERDAVISAAESYSANRTNGEHDTPRDGGMCV